MRARTRLATAIGFTLLAGYALSMGPARRTPMAAGISASASRTTCQHRQFASRPKHHYEYVFPSEALVVFDMDDHHHVAKTVRLPTDAGVRGVVACPSTGRLYVSFGGNGGEKGSGSMLAYDLRSDTVTWVRSYPFGIDSMAISADGQTIYMPEGESAAIPSPRRWDLMGRLKRKLKRISERLIDVCDKNTLPRIETRAMSSQPGESTWLENALMPTGNKWYVLNARDGSVRGSIAAGQGPHNTVASPDGTHLYLGPRFDPYLYIADASDGRIVAKVGPVRGDGVRPFSVNHKQTLAFITVSDFLGFQVADLRTGRILHTVPVGGYSFDPAKLEVTAPSHGISLSPDEREIYVIDTPNSAVHVFDTSGLPESLPRQVADIALQGKTIGDESPCLSACERDGWLQHSLDGRYVYVGDSGDVIETATRKTLVTLPALHNTRMMLEIDFDDQGNPVRSTPREGLGYAPNSSDRQCGGALC
jgi:DNA-binding beta-propeller fold protein YncE